ncbi:unnamed protein product, partial [Mesorhabditis spiculigera]
MRVGSSGSRVGTGRLARFSQSSIRANGAAAGTVSSAGGAPLTSADPLAGGRAVKHRFEIVKKLGSGTYGKVSLAYDHKMDREVAVKLIKKSAIENKADLVRIRREIRIMSALNHPNIIQIFEVFENKEKIILVMEYANGGELYDFVSSKGSLPEAEARRIFRQITSAVLYCHKHLVAHRDLKLENILLDEQGNAKIADFGLSNYFADKNLLTTFCGSPLYASPEIINGTPYKGPEVDCWSLGILLYTLVYGSMPFDGRDFNRMVRQIKRGAYYEPETPSTASMLIRNMLRVNPERRATIFDIASHWWLNLDEGMPVIQELPENQITDHTPLTERAETMVVQDLADETDVFMEFGHLSHETRRKIEEFRRRRKEAEEYNDACPVKPPKTRKTENGVTTEEMRSDEKSLVGRKEEKNELFDDPLERLRQIENKLSGKGSARRVSKVEELKDEERATPSSSTPRRDSWKGGAPAFIGRDVSPPPAAPPPATTSSTTMRAGSGWRLETDSLNVLMNQVLEQMEKGPVSLNMVTRIKAHPLYDHRPMVKELLESIIATQPHSVAEKIAHQPTSPVKPKPTTSASGKKKLQTRPWNSVEVGFDEDVALEQPHASVVKKEKTGKISPEEGDSEEEEYSDSELEELAEEVEQELQEPTHIQVEKTAPAPATVPPKVEVVAEPAPPDPVLASGPAAEVPPVDPQFLDAFDRGLIKRQSKGKYQNMMADLYGRGMVLEEPDLPRRRIIGGPQPTRDLSPLLFDKAKKYIMTYPNVAGDGSEGEELENGEGKKKKKKKTQAPPWRGVAAHSRSPSPTRGCAGSVPPRTPPLLKSDTEEETDEDEDEEEEEEKPQPAAPQKPAFTSPTQAPTATNGTVETAPKPMQGKYIVTVAELKSPTSKYAPTTNGHPAAAKPAAAPSTVAPVAIEPKEYNPVHLTAGSRLSVEGPSGGGAIGGGTVAGTVGNGPTTASRPRPQAYTRRAISSVGETADLVAHYLGRAQAKEKEKENVESPEKDDEAGKDKAGKHSWESAAAYIRRKNRERRIRNRTIGDPEDVLRALSGVDIAGSESRGDYSSTSNYSAGTGYTPSYMDRATRATRDYSPERDYGYGTRGGTSTHATPASSRKYDEDPSTAPWNVNRFEVYRPLSGVRSRLVTPELSAVSEHPAGAYSSSSYGYGGYERDSHLDRESLGRDDKPRSILKNKNDVEPASSVGGVRGVIDRLRRHLSLEKTQSPPPVAFPSSDAAKMKKRSSIDMNRRKTSELRLGDGGTITTIGYSEASSGYKRASPPRDTKGLSWRTEPSTTSTDYPYLGASSRYDTGTSSTADKYGVGSSSGYTSKLSTTASASRDPPYVPQYRKYPGSSTGRDSSALNRYSYTPGATQRYTWYDDPNIY